MLLLIPPVDDDVDDDEDGACCCAGWLELVKLFGSECVGEAGCGAGVWSISV